MGRAKRTARCSPRSLDAYNQRERGGSWWGGGGRGGTRNCYAHIAETKGQPIHSGPQEADVYDVAPRCRTVDSRLGSREIGSTMLLRIYERADVLACFDETKSHLHPTSIIVLAPRTQTPPLGTNQPRYGIHVSG